MGFAHLHLHSEYSLLDGACRLKDFVSTIKELGQNSAAVTDHGNMFGALEFYLEAKAQGIKPIIGCEAYVAPRSRFDKTAEYDSKPFHLILLCENNTGYSNLCKLISLAWTEGFYGKPRIDEELLELYHDGLICLSACVAGELPRLILNGEFDAAYKKAQYYRQIFGEDNFFLEIQDHGLPEEETVNKTLKKMSHELGIPLVCTNDCHYVQREDASVHDILLCIQTGKTVDDTDRMKFPNDEFYIKSESEMRSLFYDVPDAIENTQRIADKCCVEFEFGNTKLPHYNVPNGEDHYQYFRRKCYEGLTQRYSSGVSAEIKNRLEYELDVINKMGFVDYFLIVSDFIMYAKNRDIPVGPGRGSGAGSLAAYCMGITDIDPIKYDLIFERFLNPERVTMPDFDVDFCSRRRGEVIDYVIRKYGSDHVAQIAAFDTMAAKSAIRDAGRAMGLPRTVVDTTAKAVPRTLNITLKKALEQSTELKALYNTNTQVKKLIDVAMKIEGMPRNTTTHAAGVVITRDPVDTYVPLAKNDDTIVTQYTMGLLEKLGLLKMDFLALRNLTILHDAKELIQKADRSFSDDMIDITDPKVYKMISHGYTDGVFQFESAGMRRVIMQLKPENIEDLIAVLSLYRPGPMDSIPKYIECRHNPQKVTYKHPLLEKILNVTYGCIVYQEQVMQIFRELAGYSFGRADVVRRAMAKKKKDVMEQERRTFIYGYEGDSENPKVDGCIKRGVDEQTAAEIFAEMESFASYAFNKSHAAAYANISYMTAWYKFYYPKQYMAALMNNMSDDRNNLVEYIDECKRLGIRVLPPHVNYSYYDFSVSGSAVTFGLAAIKGLGPFVAAEIVKEREFNGEYKSFVSFCSRIAGKRVNVQSVESLIKAGALDGIGANRQQMLLSARKVLEGAEKDRRGNVEGQMSLFGDMASDQSVEMTLPDCKEFSAQKLLAMEKEVTGLFLTGHPLDEYRPFINSAKLNTIAAIIKEREVFEDKPLHFVVLVNTIRMMTTKKQQLMAFAAVEDLSAGIEMIVFPKTLTEYNGIFFEGSVLEMWGHIVDDENDLRIICDRISPAPKAAAASQSVSSVSNAVSKRASRIFIKLPSRDSKECDYTKKLLAVFDGTTPVSLYYSDTKTYDHLPRSNNVDINDVMVAELKRVLGKDSVVLK